ncbi:hypothetical protein BO94DRAFT_538463 [Aspergillus sclerotioniger CBS 115572]|uniref:Uncharacterized protein n=1 Tax=Aspergillus sclerotioniger CBS 115572 TaxID=1450535 RepID=A0A317VSR0_9EURO|nr:hypothetical protein BO94DRAFT_538463 [Aspergillus sclerotioniger CBS 115572]PWY76067.1 hypothetical protein BO94DRAFT_538463 [Aspergillus sclerotioniger CBS 115572]
MATDPNPLNLDAQIHPLAHAREHVLFDLLARYLPADSPITAAQAAREINAHFPYFQPRYDPTLPHQESGQDFCFNFWELAFRLPPQLDYREEPMQRFLALRDALSELPPVILKDGDEFDGRSAWNPPFYFHMMLIERLNQIGNPEEVGDKWDIRWRNMNGFLAHLTNSGKRSYLGNALTTIRMGLEENPRKAQPKNITYNCRAPAAAIWFILCAPKIYAGCREGISSGRPSMSLWTGESGLNLPRWEFWLERLETLKGHSVTTQETKDMCQAAIEAMNRCTVDG